MHDEKPEPCRCGHGREWHNACSKCLCPFWLPKSVTLKEVVAEWKALFERRKAKETT